MLMQRFAMLVIAAILSASPAWAQDEEVRPDARTEGYVKGEGQQAAAGPLFISPERGTSTAWFILAAVSAIGVGVMFKNGRRTHLD